MKRTQTSPTDQQKLLSTISTLRANPLTSTTAVIHTRNEASRLPTLIRSLQPWVQQVLVVDMESSDGTPEIARKMGAEVLCVKNVGYADPVREFSRLAVRTPWILSIDADEIVPATLAAELLRIAVEGQFDAVSIPFRTWFIGKELRGSGWRNDRHTRFFRTEAMRFSGEVHNFARLTSGARLCALDRKMELSILHFNYQSIGQFVDKMNRYTTAEVSQLGRRSIAKELWQPLREIPIRFVYRRGYLDGWRGVYLALLMTAYRIVEAGKRREVNLRAAGLDVIAIENEELRDVLAGFGVTFTAEEHELA
jgi:glycosyltransferase involved in cell wall biosynthesis